MAPNSNDPLPLSELASRHHALNPVKQDSGSEKDPPVFAIFLALAAIVVIILAVLMLFPVHL